MKFPNSSVNLASVTPCEFRMDYRSRLVVHRPFGEDWICPKCQVKMESRQLKGVVVERCPSCSGIFLDDGELEELTAMQSKLRKL